ncbi:MAG: PorT family protein [Rhizobacter sp.]|nr:PorT family protein [Ferruginibacter sp.]
MKKYFLLPVVTIMLLGINKSFAQSKVDIGIKGGLSIPNLTSGSSASPINNGYNSRLGFDAALQAEFHLSKHFSLQPELEYSQQGGKKDGNQAFAVPDDMVAQFPAGQVPPYLYADYNSVAKINYLMLPILAKYRFDIGKHWGAYAAAGPFVSLVSSAKNVTSGSSNIYLDEQQTEPVTTDPQSFDNTEKIKSDLHSFNTGVSGHLGINYKLPKGSIFVEGGGNYGLVDIQKDGTNGKNKTGAAVVNLGYQFSLCKHK